MLQAARYCAIVIGLQILFALLSLWILVDLSIMGTPVNVLALVLAGFFVAAQICILVLALRLRLESS